MSLDQQLVLFLFCIIGGVVCEGIFSHVYRKHIKKKPKVRFSFLRYFFLLLLPIIGTLITFLLAGIPAIKTFFIFTLLGPIFEWCVGFSYESIVGEKLWTYQKYSITGNTSLLAIPFWGFAGILFYYLARIL